MSAPNVKLAVLLDLLESDHEEFTSMLDLKTGEMVLMEDGLVRAAEEGDEESLNAVSEWQKPDAELARLIAADDGQRFIQGPKKFDFHEYRHMERFIGTIETEEIADQLWKAIKGKGAFRYFKDTAERLGLLERWFAYRDEAMKKFVLDWAGRRHIKVEV